MTHEFPKNLFTIDVTQCDFLAYPLAIRPYHMIYGQPLTTFLLDHSFMVKSNGWGGVVGGGPCDYCVRPSPNNWV